MSRARARQLIEEQLEELGKLRNAHTRDPNFKHWRQATLTVIQRVWSGEPKRSERFRAIPFSPARPNPDAHNVRETYARGCVEATSLLKSMLQELADDAPAPELSGEPAEAPRPMRLPAPVAEDEAVEREPEPAPRKNGNGKKAKKDKTEMRFDPSRFAAEIEARVTGEPLPPPPEDDDEPVVEEVEPRKSEVRFDLASLGAEFEARAAESDEPEPVEQAPAAEAAPSAPTSRERFVPPADVPVPRETAADTEPLTRWRPETDVFPREGDAAPPAPRREKSAARTRRAPAHPVAEVPEFEMLSARTLAAIAADIHRFVDAENEHVGARAHLLSVARGLDRGEMDWDELRIVLHFVIDRPALARKVLPLLVPYLDEAA